MKINAAADAGLGHVERRLIYDSYNFYGATAKVTVKREILL